MTENESMSLEDALRMIAEEEGQPDMPLTVETDWIAVEDRLPEPVLVSETHWGSDTVEIMTHGTVLRGECEMDKRTNRVFWYSTDTGEPLSGVTYWRPLPAPPADE